MKPDTLIQIYLFGLSLISVGIGGIEKDPWVGITIFGSGIILMVFSLCVGNRNSDED